MNSTQELLTPKQVAELCQVQPATIGKWHRQGRLPAAVQLNQRVLRWRAADIDKWLQQRSAEQGQD